MVTIQRVKQRVSRNFIIPLNKTFLRKQELNMKNILRAFLISVALLIICGIVFPLVITGVSSLVFPYQAKGSMIEYNGQKIGSELIGQNFKDDRFFHGRVSAVNYNTYTKENLIEDNDGKKAYNGVSSGSANLAPSNPALVERIKKDIEEFKKSHPYVKEEDIPTDLLTSSGSGLDPHISVQSAKIQIPLISKTTGISEDELLKIVDNNTEGRSLGVFGEERVNVLKANIDIKNIIK